MIPYIGAIFTILSFNRMVYNYCCQGCLKEKNKERCIRFVPATRGKKGLLPIISISCSHKGKNGI
jgi:hypothetical protein